ncbi:hypothetical protein EBA24_12025 [Xanthomonas oryzae pv. oryzae]|nr:hypothetical protein EYR26_08220 [Xanthomonas oryzae]QBO06342.1 hypothetical protein EBA22_12030 [Xanthomonas oryzae pv. oryzae]QBO10120.1 hypothetical protein EBA23_12040 [Xanthomonas oryzae pv. oryzae]QBO13909.1 hypothetical protein EBA24_12025 [Xanthomonas oryzae pv. oryzae]QBO17705.1 hypothetical protein EBA25_12050 [Xanthomonas oryzae pv. oryzae]
MRTAEANPATRDRRVTKGMAARSQCGQLTDVVDGGGRPRPRPHGRGIAVALPSTRYDRSAAFRQLRYAGVPLNKRARHERSLHL